MPGGVRTQEGTLKQITVWTVWSWDSGSWVLQAESPFGNMEVVDKEMWLTGMHVLHQVHRAAQSEAEPEEVRRAEWLELVAQEHSRSCGDLQSMCGQVAAGSMKTKALISSHCLLTCCRCGSGHLKLHPATPSTSVSTIQKTQETTPSTQYSTKYYRTYHISLLQVPHKIICSPPWHGLKKGQSRCFLREKSSFCRWWKRLVAQHLFCLVTQGRFDLFSEMKDCHLWQLKTKPGSLWVTVALTKADASSNT